MTPIRIERALFLLRRKIVGCAKSPCEVVERGTASGAIPAFAGTSFAHAVAARTRSPAPERAGRPHGHNPSAKSRSQGRRREAGVWQRRFWEHAIRDDSDFERHVDYIHSNPAKHGYVT